MDSSESRQTAYPYNATKQSQQIPSRNHGWTATINRLLEQRFAFLPQQYEENAYLFRGMSCGLLRALLDNYFWHFNESLSVSCFEQELDILCVSQDFSDSYTFSRLWGHNPDACIVITRADIFNKELRARKAAILGMAEPGVVFRYPFFTRPLTLQEIELVIVSPLLLAAIKTGCLHEIDKQCHDEQHAHIDAVVQQMLDDNRLLVCPEIYQRQELEHNLSLLLEERSIRGAKPVASDLMPQKQ